MNFHLHCNDCFKLNCDDLSCKFVDCNHCELRLHECKLQDHLDGVCSRVRIRCINSESGCNARMFRDDLRIHLEKCPASVVSCSFINIARLHSDMCCRWPTDVKYKDYFKQEPLKDDSSLTANLFVEGVNAVNGYPKDLCTNRQQSRPKQVCDSDYRRDEYCAHYENVHCNIMPSLNGCWMEKFCPNQQYGCTFNTKRIRPLCNNEKSSIVFSKQNKSFGHRAMTTENGQTHSTTDKVTLTHLPVEVITHIFGYLDAFSLNNVSLTNKLLRSLCCGLLEKRGMVSLIWRKNVRIDGISWTIAGYRWTFSNHFSLVRKWEFDDEEFLNHFSKDCKHFDQLVHKEPFQLIGIGIKKEKKVRL